MTSTTLNKVSELSTRIAALTSIGRAAADDVVRAEHHGGGMDEYRQAVESHVARLRKMATDLEKTIA